MAKNIIEIYIDGACSGNPGKSGYGIVLLFPTGDKIEVSEFIPSATNNQAELAAAIAALRLLPDELDGFKIKVFSDSNYIVKGITEWLKDWKENDWVTKRGPLKNKPMWEELENNGLGEKVIPIMNTTADVMNLQQRQLRMEKVYITR